MSHRDSYPAPRRGSIPSGWRFGLVPETAGLALLLLLAAARGAPSPGWMTPPPPPQVPPLIRAHSSADLNGNRIDDALESALRAPGGLSIASALPRVAVELVFREPITQRHIDEFLRLGGQITYIYRAISYGWNGLIPAQSIERLPNAMGPTLVQVEAPLRLTAYMDKAAQSGRVRPIWRPGFAGSLAGYSGDPNTTIAFLGYGVDDTHTDLRGRCVYWRDFTDENEPQPVDYDGHDTMVAGVAVGTGAAGGMQAGPLYYTTNSLSPGPMLLVDPIALPTGGVTVTVQAFWTGPGASLWPLFWTKGTNAASPVGVPNQNGLSPLPMTTSLTPSPQNVYSFALAVLDGRGAVDPFGKLQNITILTMLSSYPGVGDGYPKFRGVAPGCKWCAVRVYRKDLYATTSDFAAGLDDLVLHRVDKNIKIIAISHGLLDAYEQPGLSGSVRDKVNSVVQNGVVVVAAGGNDAGWTDLMADPARAALVLTVAASNNENGVTYYSTPGFLNPRLDAGEDYKPDLLAPGGSWYYGSILSCESNTSDCSGPDRRPNDYGIGSGTSLAAGFAAGCAALVIDALQQHGLSWKFDSAEQPKYVKMLLCATASETNTRRELVGVAGTTPNPDPTLERAAGGPNGFPPGKDRGEGYGVINPDAAVEAVSLTYIPGTTVTGDLGGSATAKRVWARTVNLRNGCEFSVSLTNPAGADFDLYLYRLTPSATGTPVLLASSTSTKTGDTESLAYAPTADGPALLVVKRVSGAGTFTVRSTQAGPPIATDVQVTGTMAGSVTIPLAATDDGRPNPPGAMTYMILSKPTQGQLTFTDGTPITTVPAKLPGTTNQVVYKAPADWKGDDSFTFCADDGGAPPTGGRSNTATVKVTVVSSVTADYQLTSGADDACMLPGDMNQSVTDPYLGVGMHTAGLRFRNLKIPPGATVTHATIKICANSGGLNAAVAATLRAEAADNPGVFAPDSHLITQVPTTSASKTWTWADTSPWTANTWYESPDLSAIIQEVVNRPGWASGNALVVLYGPRYPTFGPERFFWSYEGAPAKAAKLSITYALR